VANRLTVSRFRNLMSTAAGQKFLNENLHRTAVLASHIPSMSPRQAAAGTQGRGAGSQLTNEGMSGQPVTPTCFPLYVRLRAVVADWDVPKDKRNEFLILGPNAAVERQVPEDSSGSDWNRTRRTKGGEPDGTVQTGGVVGGVLEQILREVLAEPEFGEIVDMMLEQETPLFAQYENTAPPGGQAPAALRFPDAAAPDEGDLLRAILGDEADGAGADPFFSEQASASRVWRSDMLLDFPSVLVPAGDREAAQADDARVQSAASGGLSKGGSATNLLAASGTLNPLDVTGSVAGDGGSASGAVAPEAEVVPDDSPERYWEDALQDFGEVDLDAFKVGAGEVLDKLLLDMMDDVVAGRLNWMRPMPRGRPRR